jgi:hypothetical protein
VAFYEGTSECGWRLVLLAYEKAGNLSSAGLFILAIVKGGESLDLSAFILASSGSQQTNIPSRIFLI